MRNVLVFGTFDPLHEGHIYFFAKARTLGEYLIVVVARDESIRAHKDREQHTFEKERLKMVQDVPGVDEAMLGDASPKEYSLLTDLDFDILALGYDQEPEDGKVRELLDLVGKHDVEIVRLSSYNPEKFKSSLLRD